VQGFGAIANNTCPTLVQDFSLYIMASLVKDLDTETGQTRNLKALEDAQLHD
jgi:hypothetical protein